MTVVQALEPPFMLFHWAPSTRRKGIGRYGLVPGKQSVCKGWKPPFVCYALNPESAWQMSGDIHPEIPEWDLWATHSDHIPRGWETLPYDDMTPKEVRIYDRIPGTSLWFVGTRQQATDQRGR